MLAPITDWDDAYANASHIEGAETFPPRWAAEATAFRERLLTAGRGRLDLSYGEGPRNQLDLFEPEGEPRGLFVFVHGGYWRAFDKSSWSHLATGALAHGFAVALPSYTLCPQASIAQITGEVGAAIEKASALIPGEIRLAGHSAGGHLVSRMISNRSPLAEDLRQRIVHTVSISGVHDLRPLVRTAMNDDFGLTPETAAAESPVLMEVMAGAKLTCWVGGDERPEFVRQSALLANMWRGSGAATQSIVEPGRHHFDVIAGLEDPDSALSKAAFGT